MRVERTDRTSENRRLGDLGPWLLKSAIAVGALGLVLSALMAFMVEEGIRRAYHAYLVNYCYFLTLSLGGLFFVMIQHLSRAGWSVVVRRVSEAVATNVVFLLILFVPILLGAKHLFPWLQPDLVAHDHLIQLKQAYLNLPFFLARCALYFAIWGGLAYTLFKKSLDQDQSGDPKISLSMEKISAPGVILFALTVTFAAFDLLMSRDPHWFSTIYGVYFFGGSYLGFVSFLALTLIVLRATGRLRSSVTIEHFHDLGKLMLGFTVFWAYIGFSQFMLIWYANLPEETMWYQRRMTGQWGTFSLVLLFGHFIIPFLLLLSRVPKRNPKVLWVYAVWILFFHWLDLYWLAMPEYGWKPEMEPTGLVPFSLLDLTTFIGLGGIYVGGLAFWLRDHSLVPEKDPRLAESVSFENA